MTHADAQPDAPASRDLAPGTFTPDPRPAPLRTMAAAQGRLEARLMLVHGEQLLLNIIIPAALLVGTVIMPVFGDIGFGVIVPMVFAAAATSVGFTGQAIALAFDRRYGALKRAGASGAPPWVIICGKIIGVLAVVAVQILILGALAFALGWGVGVGGALAGLATLLVGVAVFTALGLYLGGSWSPEIVLAVANLIWIVLMGTLGWVVYSFEITDAGWWYLVPSVALTGALINAFQLAFNATAWLALLGWGVAGAAAAARWFRFDA